MNFFYLKLLRTWFIPQHVPCLCRWIRTGSETLITSSLRKSWKHSKNSKHRGLSRRGDGDFLIATRRRDFNPSQEKIATWNLSLNESHGFLINRVGVSAPLNVWLLNLICRIFSFRTVPSSKNGASASTRRRVMAQRSLPRRSWESLRWMFSFNPSAFRRCPMDCHETSTNENVLFRATFWSEKRLSTITRKKFIAK